MDGRRRAARRAGTRRGRESGGEGFLSAARAFPPTVEWAYVVPPASALVLWSVSGNLPLALAFLGLGLAGIGALVARFYDLQMEKMDTD